MLNKDIKKKIDDARDTLVGVLPLPTDQIELITIALIYKFMDDQDEELRQVGLNEKFFTGELKGFSWQQLLSNQLTADARVTKFINGIEAIQKAKHIPALFRDIFLNAFLKFRDPKVLQRFLDIIDGFKYDHSEELGNAFEYLLKTMGAQGDNGQFRTPRNIIDFMVEVVDPDKDETILDPACGTGGFLVSAFKHILRRNTKGYEEAKVTLENYVAEGIPVYWGAKLSSSQRSAIEKNIVGYDNTPLMVRLARVNLYLHHFGNPQIHEYNTLNTDTRWKDKFDCILANPPFMTPKGGIDPHDKFRILANRTEILFASYILQHLNPDGKAGFVVPEGIIFQTAGDYVALRNWMIYEAGLWAVVSLPSQVFQPYSGVKTSIVFCDRELARKRKEVLLVKVDNDGFSLNTNRTPIKLNDLPQALEWLELCKNDLEKFVNDLEEKKTTPFAKNLCLLPRDEFARLDTYKATSSAYSFCKKQHEKTLKAKEDLETKLLQDPNNGEKAKEKYEKQVADFYKQTNINFVPDTEDKLKEWFDTSIKDSAIEYGVNLNNDNKLTKELLDFIDWQREFNLSFDKYTTSQKDSEHFESKRLEELTLEIKNGYNVTQTDDESGVAVSRIQTIWNGEIDLSKVKFTPDGIDNEMLLRSGDILLSHINSVEHIGKTAIFNERVHGKMVHGINLLKIKPNKELINPSYLLQILKSDQVRDYIRANCNKAVNQASVSSAKIKDLQIPLPPLEIQDKVVSEIEMYQKVIEGCELQIENYKPTFVLNGNYPTKKFDEIVSVISGGTPSREVKEYWDNPTIPWLRSEACKDLVVTEAKEFISKKGFENSSAKLLKPKSTLIALVGATIGKTAFITFETTTNQNVAGIYPLNEEELLPEYLFLATQTLYGEFMRLGESKFKMANLSFIKGLEIPVPPIEEQKIIVSEINLDFETLKGATHLKNKMQAKIKSIIDKVWGR